MSNQSQPEPQILCVYASPRVGGNTDLLMDAFVEGANEGGAITHRVYLRDLKISPCLAIEACAVNGTCAIEDDMTPLYKQLRTADAVALATPVMFYGPSAIAKAFIDRCQALWNIKYIIKDEVSTGRLSHRRGVLLSAGGSKGVKLFDALKMTYNYFLDTLGATLWGEVLVRSVDAKGDILGVPAELERAKGLGSELARLIKEDIAKP